MMKFRLLSLVAIALAMLPSSRLMAQREITDLADGWKFIKQDAAPDAAYAAWESVTVPHTWNAQDGQTYNKDGYYRGPGWYAKELEIPTAWKDKRVFIRFEAASLVADVYLNGQKLGVHIGGFTPFTFEVTQLLKKGENSLVVKVDDQRLKEGVPTLNMDWWNYGGITREVKIITVPKEFIADHRLALESEKTKIISDSSASR